LIELGDETSLNNVDLVCCKVENPGKYCSPSSQWKTLTSCTGSEICSASYTAKLFHTGESRTRDLSDYFGFPLSVAYKGLTENFEKLHEDGFEGRTMKEIITPSLVDEMRIETSFYNCSTSIEYLELNCDYYTVNTRVHRCKP